MRQSWYDATRWPWGSRGQEGRREPVNAQFVTTSGLVTDILPSKAGQARTSWRPSRRSRSCWPTERGRRNSGDRARLAVTPHGLTTAQAQAAAPLMVKISEWKTYFPIGEKNGFGATSGSGARDRRHVVGPHETSISGRPSAGHAGEGLPDAARSSTAGPSRRAPSPAGSLLLDDVVQRGAACGLRDGRTSHHYYYIDRYPLVWMRRVSSAHRGRCRRCQDERHRLPGSSSGAYKIKQGATAGTSSSSCTASRTAGPWSSASDGQDISPRDGPRGKSPTPLAAGVRKRIEYPVDGKQVWRTVPCTTRLAPSFAEDLLLNYSRVTASPDREGCGRDGTGARAAPVESCPPAGPTVPIGPSQLPRAADSFS